MERKIAQTARTAVQIFEDVKRISEGSLGIQPSYKLILQPAPYYLTRRNLSGLSYDGNSIIHINYNEGVVFVTEDWNTRVLESSLAGYMGYYSIKHFAFSNLDQKNTQEFEKLAVVDGIAFHGQSIVKEGLARDCGYFIDEGRERRLRDAFFAKNPPAIVGDDVSREQCESSGQTKMIKPIVLTAVVADNPTLSVHHMRGKYFVNILRDSPLKPGIDYEIVVSKDEEIMENVKGIEHLVVQQREMRDAIPKFARLVELLDDEVDGKEKRTLVGILQEVTKRDQNQMRMTLKLEDLSEYKLFIQPALINIAARRNQEGRKYAIIY